MVYSAHPPYEILQNKLIDFATMQRLRRFARYWDLVGNSGNFLETTPLLWSNEPAPFNAFLKFSDWFYAKVRRQHSIALAYLAEMLFGYLTAKTHCQLNTWQNVCGAIGNAPAAPNARRSSPTTFPKLAHKRRGPASPPRDKRGIWLSSLCTYVDSSFAEVNVCCYVLICQ